MGAGVLSKGVVVLRGIVQADGTLVMRASAADLTSAGFGKSVESSHSSNHLTNKNFEG
jgi:hypothetical protein